MQQVVVAAGQPADNRIGIMLVAAVGVVQGDDRHVHIKKQAVRIVVAHHAVDPEKGSDAATRLFYSAFFSDLSRIAGRRLASNRMILIRIILICNHEVELEALDTCRDALSTQGKQDEVSGDDWKSRVKAAVRQYKERALFAQSCCL
nr:hypothetical protein [Noviherbaspirillum cavernae]